MKPLSPEQALSLHLRAQRLLPQEPGAAASAAQVVQAVCGLQAQELPASVLSVRPRSSGLTAADVERARLEARSILRTWCQRGTLHLVATEDWPWLIALLGPGLISAGRRRFAELGLDGEAGATGLRVLRAALAGQGPLTREQIAQHLRAHDVPAGGQAPYHLIYRMALEGAVCLGPERDGKPTYVLVEDWAGPPHGRVGAGLSREAALAELARRYLAAYAPAGPEDLAAWSGLGIREARTAMQGIASELVQVEISGRPAWMLASQAKWLDEPPAPSPVVRLLPRFDTYLLGYAGRELAVAPEHARRIHPGGGILHPALLVDGRAQGTWSTKRRRSGRRDRVELSVAPFAPLAPEVVTGVEAEAADLARFLEVDVTIKVEEPR